MMPELPLVGDEFAGYRMRAVLGRGGMSVVYQAESLRLGNVVALKVLAPELAADDVFRARFLEESRIAASLNHPNVIPIYDMGSGDGLLFIAMRYVSGTDLRQVIKKRGRLVPGAALLLLGQVARALDTAHRRGLVHRDVKPGNMLIERGAGEGDPDHVYLADFGITKHAMSRTGLTSTGQFLGTIDYVAPEQIRGGPVAGLADQYSLGCVLYECLTGRVPFEKDLDAAVIWAHVEEIPVMPAVLRPELPPRVDGVFGRVLAKQPGDRYGSCREFIDAARTALGVSGPGTGSSLTYSATAPAPGAMAPAPRFAASPGDLGQVRGERYSWSSPPGQAAASVPAAPVPPGPAAAAPAGPREPRWYRRPRWIAALAAVVLILAGLGTWAGLSRPGPAPKATRAAMSPKPEPARSALMAALILANQSTDAKGLIPPPACKQGVPAVVTCTAPAPGITGVVFRTFPGQQGLYTAYTAKVAALSPGHQFRQDFADCESQVTYGEVGWNHLFRHTKAYSVAQMTAGTVTDDQAAGRVFCTYTQGLEYMVWTQDDGHLLGYVAGPVHTDVWNWWVRVHHDIGIGGTPMDMQMPGTSPSANAVSPAMNGTSPSPSMSSMGG